MRHNLFAIASNRNHFDNANARRTNLYRQLINGGDAAPAASSEHAERSVKRNLCAACKHHAVWNNARFANQARIQQRLCSFWLWQRKALQHLRHATPIGSVKNEGISLPSAIAESMPLAACSAS